MQAGFELPQTYSSTGEINKARTVVSYLNDVDYSEDPHYVPSEFALTFLAFIKLVNGGQGEENKTPVIHLKMLDQLVAGDLDVLNMVFRGAAKTTIFGEYLFLFLAVYGYLPVLGKVNLALYVSDSIENGVKNMRKNLEFRRENSEFLMKYLPEVRFTDIRWEFKNLDGKVFIVKGYGAKTGVRGSKELGTRPQLAILDDLISDEDARSDTIIAAVEDTVTKALEHALHPKNRRIIWSGTPFNARDPLYKAVESGAWHVNVFPVCEKFPCTREEFKGAWEDRFGYDEVMARYVKAIKQGKLASFNQELMLRIMSEEDRLIGDHCIKWYNRSMVLNHLDRYNIYITTDFAVSERDSADFSVISVWALNPLGQWFWVDGVCKRQNLSSSINDLFRLAQKYKPMSVGVEVTGQQQGFVSFIQEKMLERNAWFHLASSNNNNTAGIRPNTNKFVRFQSVEPWFQSGIMFFPEQCKLDMTMLEAMEELSLVSASGFRSKHDDFLDTISMLGMMETWRPLGDSQEAVQDYSGMWGFHEEDVGQSSLQSYVV